jgi:uncharacterized protein YjbI with pentapeptide repeats
VDADLSTCDYRGANLSGADFRGANLWRTNLSSSDTTGADFRGSYLNDTIMPDGSRSDGVRPP